MNPYEPQDLMEASQRARASLAQLTQAEKLALMRQIGMINEAGQLQPAFDWCATQEEEAEYLAGKPLALAAK